MVDQVRQRISPRLWDHCYFQTRPALETFEELRFLFPEPIRLLDLGCGEKVYEKLFPAARYVGIDYTREGTRADVVADAAAIPFPDDAFDLVVCSELLEHVYPIERVLSELKRVCKPGGYVYISTPFLFPIHGRTYDFYRYTRLFYFEAFRGSDFLAFREANLAYSIPLVLVNRLLHQAFRSGLLRPVYFLVNCAIAAIEAASGVVARVFRGREGVQYRLRAMPAGYSMVIRLKK
jgi:SAM-dependent methyltransferase